MLKWPSEEPKVVALAIVLVTLFPPTARALTLACEGTTTDTALPGERSPISMGIDVNFGNASIASVRFDHFRRISCIRRLPRMAMPGFNAVTCRAQRATLSSPLRSMSAMQVASPENDHGTSALPQHALPVVLGNSNETVQDYELFRSRTNSREPPSSYARCRI
jgi:hypothetical protein